ncbi:MULTISPECIES: T9SS type A sorting domain-containing protein [Flavobacterium]|uniref:T9SS type A sorting domain-containing protein n=1 Tax=Flavobacterium hankyongi TaxID=1176532 RepID=A0ABP8ZM17_9FLAO|nr:T9SS type A sorting domain-containing protein [Flavobacterium sp. N1846]
MKKIYFIGALLATVMSFGQTFSFTETGALSANGWTTHSGTAGQQTILTSASDSGNSLYKAGLAVSTGNRTAIVAGNSEDVNKAITAPITSGSVYYSVLVKVDPTALNLNSSTGDYSIAVTNNATASTTTFQARIYMKQGTAGGFLVGALNNSGGTANPTYATTELAANTTHLLVMKYDLATNTASLFINPTPGSAEPAPSSTNATGTTAAPTQIAGFVIRQGGNATAGTGNVEIDEIRVGQTWASVTPSNLSVAQNNITGLKVYPNPAKNTLYVTSDSFTAKEVQLYDVLGKSVLNTKTVNNTVNISSLSKGVYVVKITEEGKTATRKIVVE